jgi:nicotinic acid mononucleotide adenylyltransferase
MVAIFTFGRFQPPHNGHKILIDTIIQKEILLRQKNINAQHFIFPSHTHKKEKDSKYPLEFAAKIYYMKSMFPYANIMQTECKTVHNIKSFLKSFGFNKMLMIVGSDQVDSFRKCMTEENGEFVACAGNKRISNSTLLDHTATNEEISATLLRRYASINDFQNFKNHVVMNNLTEELAFHMMNDVRQGLLLNRVNPSQVSATGGRKRRQLKHKRKIKSSNKQKPKYKPKTVKAR